MQKTFLARLVFVTTKKINERTKFEKKEKYDDYYDDDYDYQSHSQCSVNCNLV